MLLNLVVALPPNPYHWSWLTSIPSYIIVLAYPYVDPIWHLPDWSQWSLLLYLHWLTSSFQIENTTCPSTRHNSFSVLILLLIVCAGGFRTVQWTYESYINIVKRPNHASWVFCWRFLSQRSSTAARKQTRGTMKHSRSHDSRKRLVQYSSIVTPLRSGVDQFCQCQVAGHCNGLGITFIRKGDNQTRNGDPPTMSTAVLIFSLHFKRGVGGGCWQSSVIQQSSIQKAFDQNFYRPS